jgi:signal transduction histidine kinase
LRTDRDLQTALIAAETAIQAKSDFVARLSHEFRTPLNAILGFSEVLQLKFFGPLGNPKYDEYAGGIHDSGGHLFELINDVLGISAIEAGKRTIVKEPLDLDGVIAESFEIMRPAAERGEVRLSVNLPADLPTLFADRRTVKQILLNLLSNAVKFSVSGGEVSTSARARANMMTIEIADNGIGIESDILPTVTDVFSRENANVHLAHEGSGLGLAIVKSLIEAHDGHADNRKRSEQGHDGEHRPASWFRRYRRASKRRRGPLFPPAQVGRRLPAVLPPLYCSAKTC